MVAALATLILKPALPAAPMLGRIDKFWIILAIVIGSAIWEWLKKKGKTEETGSGGGGPESPRFPSAPHRTMTTPPATATAPRSAMSDWEAELRRLLGGEPPIATPPPSAPPPIRPVVIQEPQTSRPARHLVAAAPVVRSVPPPLAQSRVAEAEKAVEVQLPALAESVSAYHRASHLHERVAERLKRIEQLTQRHPAETPTVRRPSSSSETARTIFWVRHPRTARQAVIASVIFGPPKALEVE